MKFLQLSLILISAVLLTSCSSTGTTRQGLVDRLGTSNVYIGSRYLYMGSKDGYDFVTQTWERDGFSNSPGSAVFQLRSGELDIPQPMNFTSDSSKWREIDVLEKPKN